MNYQFNLDQATQQIIDEETAGGGETVWWAGKPSPFSMIRSRFSLTQAIFPIFFIGVFVFIGRQFLQVFSSGSFSRGMPAFFPYFFIAIFLFIAFTALKSFLSPLWDLIGSFFTVYVITNQRAMIIQRLPRKSVKSYLPKDFDNVQRIGNDHRGDVLFSSKTITVTKSNSIGFGNNDQYGHNRSRGDFNIPLGSRTSQTHISRDGFFGVSNPREVEDMLLSLAKTAE